MPALGGEGTVGSQSVARFSRTRGRTGSDYGLQYPSPFFDIAHTYLPATVKQMFRWCRYYFLVNPLINAIVFKMSEYPITDVLFDTEREELREKWRSFLLEDLRYRSFQIEIGLDYYTYGNALVSIFFPFVKLLKCPKCGLEKPAKDSEYRFQNYQFHQLCTRCNYHGPVTSRDHYTRVSKGIRLLRWNPEDVDIRYNDLTGEYEYYYEIPVQMKNDIMIGRKSVVETVPQLFIDALKLKKAVVFSRDNIYHFKRPTLAGKDRGWGTPLILPVLKDTFYLQILRKAQEAIALEHIVPLRVLFPQAGSATSDPYCVSLDSLVETRTGIKPAGEVGEGAFLKTHSGAWKKVEYAINRPIRTGEKAYEFTVASLAAFPFTVSEEHPLLTAKRPGNFRGYDSIREPEFVQARDVQEGDFVCYPRRRLTWDRLELDWHDYHPERAYTEKYIYRRLNQESAEIYEYFEREGVPEFDHGEKKYALDKNGWSDRNYLNARAAFSQQNQIDRVPRYIEVTEELAYLIGLYAAEGSPKSDGASLSLNTSESAIMERVDRILQGMGFPIGHRHVRDNSTQYDIDDIFIGGFLAQVCGNGAQNKYLPRFLIEAPNQIALRAVEGVFDGDGCSIRTTTRREGLKTVSPQLAVDVRTLLLSYGLIAAVQKNIPRADEISKLPYYQINLNGSQGDELQRLFQGLQGSRGFSRCGFMRGDYVYLRVGKREEATQVTTVRGFQIEGDKSFCVVGVATHNTSVNLQDWRDQISNEIRRWRADNNYIPILPLPIGHQTIGGDGRALLLSQEIRVWSEHIVAGTGVPVELIFGGLSYSGSNVSLRMLENTFLGYLQDHAALLKWVIRRTSSWLNWAPVRARFKPFKMADDLQRKAYLLQLNQFGKLSDESLLADADYDSSKEDKILDRESARRAEATKKSKIVQADVEGEAMMVQMKWQAKAQERQMRSQTAIQTEAAKEQIAYQGAQQRQMMQEQMAAQTGQPASEPPSDLKPHPRDPDALKIPQEIQSPLSLRSVRHIPTGTGPDELAGQTNVDLLLMARQIADRLSAMEPAEKAGSLQQLRSNNPELYDTVLGLMMSGSNGPSRASAAAARPLPAQRPPRRGPEAQLV